MTVNCTNSAWKRAYVIPQVHKRCPKARPPSIMRGAEQALSPSSLLVRVEVRVTPCLTTCRPGLVALQIIAGDNLNISLCTNATLRQDETPGWVCSVGVFSSVFKTLPRNGLCSLPMTEASPLVLYPVRCALSHFCCWVRYKSWPGTVHEYTKNRRASTHEFFLAAPSNKRVAFPPYIYIFMFVRVPLCTEM